jgi:hypothetical protein
MFNTLFALAVATLCLGADRPAPASRVVDLTTIDGANIDETTIARTIVVDIINPPVDGTAARGTDANPCSSLREALSKAIDAIDRNVPTRVLLKAGVYREALVDLDFAKLPGVVNNLLVIEGADPEKVVLTGADAWPLHTWKDEGGGLYSRPWPYRFGMKSPPWGPKRLIGHRSEMVFVGDRPLRQRLLESYKTTGLDYAQLDRVEYQYTGKHEPSVLKPGEFGIYERLENDPRIFARLTPEQIAAGASLEVSTRQRLLNLGAKQNFVLRNVTVTRFANSLGTFFPEYPIDLQLRYTDNAKPQNILIDNCRFLWNNGMAINVVGDGFTVRDTISSYNGFSGINGDESRDTVLQNNTTNFNGWRAYWGEEVGWFTAGVKMHKTVGQKVLGHTSIGNTVGGFWYDIHCKHIYVENCTTIANPFGQMWELSQGPLHGKRLLSVGGKYEQGGALRLWEVGEVVVEDSVFWQNYPEHNQSPSATVHLHYSKRSSEQTDEHARMDRITPERAELRNNVIAAGPDSRVPLWYTDFRPFDKQTSVPIEPIFASNVYYSSRVPKLMLLQTGMRYSGWDIWGSIKLGEWEPDLRDLAEWSKQTGDTGSRVARTPPIVGVEQWSARVVGIPNADQYPSFTMTPELRAQLDWFTGWTGFSPTVWTPIPDLDGPVD